MSGARRRGALRTPLRDHAPVVLVAGLAAAFGVTLLQVTGLIAAAAEAVGGDRPEVGTMLPLLASVFIAIAVYVAAVVTANTVATVIAGRVREIALLRLLGATARAQRRAVARGGLLAGTTGAVLGGVIGTLVAIGLGAAGVAAGHLPDIGYGYAEPVVLLPVVVVPLTTWLAAWIGSRRVLAVTPLQALGAAVEPGREQVVRGRARHVSAAVLAVAGGALLALAVVAGLAHPAAVLIGIVGGILSFTGLLLGADRVMPPVLGLVGRWSGRGVPGRLAAENALRSPQRSSRATIGIVIGVSLITMFGVAAASFEHMLVQSGRLEEGGAAFLDGVVAVFGMLIGFSALIAAIGLMNTLSLSVLQRRRELGLLRALGLSSGQVRRMVLAEAAQLVAAAVLFGVLLGVGYGWAGAQSLLGSLAGLVPPVVPWPLLGVIAGLAAGLALAASWAPSRRALRVSPVAALAVE